MYDACGVWPKGRTRAGGRGRFISKVESKVVEAQGGKFYDRDLYGVKCAFV